MRQWGNANALNGFEWVDVLLKLPRIESTAVACLASSIAGDVRIAQ